MSFEPGDTNAERQNRTMKAPALCRRIQLPATISRTTFTNRKRS